MTARDFMTNVLMGADVGLRMQIAGFGEIKRIWYEPSSRSLILSANEIQPQGTEQFYPVPKPAGEPT